MYELSMWRASPELKVCVRLAAGAFLPTASTLGVVAWASRAGCRQFMPVCLHTHCRRAPRRSRHGMPRARMASSWKPRRIRKAVAMTQRRGTLCVLRLRLGPVPDIPVFAPPHLPARVIRPQCPWCSLPCLPALTPLLPPHFSAMTWCSCPSTSLTASCCPTCGRACSAPSELCGMAGWHMPGNTTANPTDLHCNFSCHSQHAAVFLPI